MGCTRKQSCHHLRYQKAKHQHPHMIYNEPIALRLALQLSAKALNPTTNPQASLFTRKSEKLTASEVRQRAVRMVLDHQGDCPSRWAAIETVAQKIGCAPQSLHEWVRKTEVDSGKRAGVPSDMAEKMMALERENRELRQPMRSCAKRQLILLRRSSTSRSRDDQIY
jgi:transposase